MPRYFLFTFGCQMNQHDSERIAEVLDGGGFSEAASLEQADVVLLNTCSVREKAEQKLRSEVGRLALLKNERPELVIGVLGCVAQQEGERLLKRMPALDLVLGPDNIPELPQLLTDLELGGPPRVRTVFDLENPQFLSAAPRLGKAPVSSFVTTMKGCNERCSFCIVPHTRGPERYRASQEIIDEIKKLVDMGTREVTLLGQTVNSYRDPSAALAPAPGAGEHLFRHTKLPQARQDESEFAALLRAIALEVPELVRLRYTSPHPRHLTASLIYAHRDLPVLARHVHLPVQSGSDRLLKRMIRRYTVLEYLERTEALRSRVPDVTLSTDVIVGFPGETREDFEATLDLVERVAFAGLFGFKYSERPYTPAKNLEDDVPESEKAARLRELFVHGDAIRRRHLESLVGSIESVLVEEHGADGRARGRTGRNEIVHFWLTSAELGALVDVRITRANNNSVEGEPENPQQRAVPVVRGEPNRALPVLG